jgi:hypothetical protein
LRHCVDLESAKGTVGHRDDITIKAADAGEAAGTFKHQSSRALIDGHIVADPPHFHPTEYKANVMGVTVWDRFSSWAARGKLETLCGTFSAEAIRKNTVGSNQPSASTRTCAIA